MSQAIARRLGAAALLVLLASLAVALVRGGLGAADALRWPYDLDYGEGIIWQQLDAIVAGRGYAPLGTLPAIVFHYPPLYHVVTAALAASSGLDPLTAGRTVSLLAALAAAGCIGWLTALAHRATPRAAVLVGAVVAGASFLATPTVARWALLMRVDLLAVALTMSGLATTAHALRRASLPAIWAAATLLALAVYTKQTALPAPAIALLLLWFAWRRAAWHFLAVSAVLGIGALAILLVATRGEFLVHVVASNVNRLDLSRVVMILATVLDQTVSLAIAAIVAAAIVRDRRMDIATAPEQAVRWLVVGYFAARVATLPIALKSGASENYMIDLFAAAAPLVGIGVARVAAAAGGAARWPGAAITALVLVGLPVQALRLERPFTFTHDPRLWADDAALVDRIRAAPAPVLTDYMVLLRRAGRPVLIEPAIVAELSSAGRYDQAGLIRLIRARRFAFVLIEGRERWWRERYTAAVRAVIVASYPRVERHGEAIMRLPPR